MQDTQTSRFLFLSLALITGLLAVGLPRDTRASYATGIADSRLTTLQSANAEHGYAMTRLGDVNGDGFLDFALSLPGESAGGTAVNRGGVAVYLGSNLNSLGPIFLEYGTLASERFGTSVSGAGDLNGDGFDDFVVGAPLWDNGATQDVGRAYVYFGKSSTVPAPWTLAAQLTGAGQAGSQFGMGVAGIGDVNGDGYADLAVGAPLHDDGAARVDAGQVRIYFGGSGTTFDTTADATMSPAAPDSQYGSAISGGGDFNGDGRSDFVVGVPRFTAGQNFEGAALLYYGGAGNFDTTADLTFESNVADLNLGRAFAGFGDVNGDGFSDVSIGAPLYDNGQTNEGAVFVFHGATTATANAVVDTILESDVAGSLFGASLAIGDSNGDGYADLAIGSPNATDYSIAEFGTVHVVRGSSTGLTTDKYQIRGLSSTTTAGRFGSSLAFVDFNGNGFPELFVGAPEETVGGRARQGALYSVQSDRRLSPNLTSSITGPQANGQFGHNMATGDINGDGLADLAVGSPGYDLNGATADSGRIDLYYGAAGGFNTTADGVVSNSGVGEAFGASVAVGDFNGDGYGDVAVGAPNMVGSGGQVRIFNGGTGAFNTTADHVVSVAQIGAGFGLAVANVGDLNGDGIVDLGVGALNYDLNTAVTESGAAFIWFGKASGVSGNADRQILMNTAAALFGWRIAGAGDVNGDGFADLAVGMRDDPSTGRGRVMIYHGGENFDTASDKQITPSTINGSRCSVGLASAGDINGDGYSDLVVGCPNQVNGSQTGAIHVYRGSSSGLMDGLPDVQIIYATPALEFGFFVAGGGDIDADGFADVLVGSPVGSSDSARWYRGSATGLLTNSETVLSSAADTRFGQTGALADLNGDGFAEVVVGAVSTASAAGAIHVAIPNGAGRDGSPQQFRSAVAPFDFEGDTTSPSGTLIAALAQSPIGRQRVKMRVELCPNGTAFGNNSCLTTTTPDWTDLTSSGAGALVLAMPDALNADTPYRWRARLIYAPMGITAAGITAPTVPAQLGPWKRMRARVGLGDLRTQANTLFSDSFE